MWREVYRTVFSWEVWRLHSSQTPSHLIAVIRDGLGEIATRHPEFSDTLHHGTTSLPYAPTTISGPQLTLNLLSEHEAGSITYVALGPLTSLAKACEMDGELVRKRIGRVLSMGGAVDVPGNTTPVAECKPLTVVL